MAVDQRLILRRSVPWLLLAVRVIFSPILILASHALSDRTVLWMYIAAFVTDYFDGVSARFLGTATPSLRKADSAADTLFHLSLAWFIFVHHSSVIRQNRIALLIYLITAAVWYTLDAIRWHRIAGFHTYSAKVFSICLLIWVVQLLSDRQTGHQLSCILIFGAVSNVEGICISLRLDKDRTDVPTLLHASR